MKEMKMFIRAEFEDCNSGRAYQKALRTVPSVRSQATVTYFFFLRQDCMPNDMVLTVYIIQI